MRSELYLDDPLWMLWGSLDSRNTLLALMLLTLCSLGLNISWRKGGRGSKVVWIGVSLQPDVAMKRLCISLPSKFGTELTEELHKIITSSMVGVRRLRSLTGRLSWAAGILPRARWAVNILYAVLASVDRDAKGGIEEQRRQRRKDQRDKSFLVPTKRVALALTFWLALIRITPPINRVPLWTVQTQFVMICDASPWGLGAVLCHSSGRPLEFFASTLDHADCQCLNIVLGDCSCQAIVEALCLLVALRRWSKHLQGQHCGLQVRSDSSAALGSLSKLSSKSPVLNFIAAEMALEIEAKHVASFHVRHIPGSANQVADALSRQRAVAIDAKE
eukprot:2831655-Amphidinium_carterae.1